METLRGSSYLLAAVEPERARVREDAGRRFDVVRAGMRRTVTAVRGPSPGKRTDVSHSGTVGVITSRPSVTASPRQLADPDHLRTRRPGRPPGSARSAWTDPTSGGRRHSRSHGGRSVIVRRSADGTLTDVLPAPWNARTRVHEYGGGAWTVSDGTLWFTEFSDQRLYRLGPGDDDAPVAVTPEPEDHAGVRHADLRGHPRRAASPSGRPRGERGARPTS